MSDPDKQPIPIEKIKNLVYDVIVHRFGVDKNSLTETTQIQVDLKADSNQQEELKKEIEKVFGITIQAGDRHNLTTPGSMISYIENIFNH
jgi:acyl carrier protein